MRSICLPICRSLLASTLLGVLNASPASGQRMTVTVTHHAAPSTLAIDKDATYQRPGDKVSEAMRGMPPRSKLVEVVPTEPVCVSVRAANPLLYNYSVSAVEAKIEPLAYLEDLAKQLSELIAGSGALGVKTRDKASAPQSYAEAVLNIALLIDEAGAIHRRSDSSSSFKVTLDADTKMWHDVESASAAAERLWKPLSTTPDTTSKGLRALQLIAMDHLRKLHERVTAAGSLLDPDLSTLTLCTSMPAGRTDFGLRISARADAAPYKPVRITSGKDEVLAAFTLEPAYVEQFRIEPGVFIAAGFAEDRDVGVANDVLTITKTGRTYTRTGIFGMARVNNWLWPTLGVAKGEGASADVFAGLQVRAGNLKYGPQLSVGLGAAWMEVPVGAGALTAGSALPDTKSLEDVITRERQIGLALTFTITGLKLSGGASGDSGGK